MGNKSYLSPKTEIRDSNIKGLGLFASGFIRKGEIVGIKCGDILSKKKLLNLGGFEGSVGKASLQVSDEFFVGPSDESDVDDVMMYVNHSCDPNVGIMGNIISVAMRDIEADEELTNDYAMWLADKDFSMKYICRKIFAGVPLREKIGKFILCRTNTKATFPLI